MITFVPPCLDHRINSRLCPILHLYGDNDHHDHDMAPRGEESWSRRSPQKMEELPLFPPPPLVGSPHHLSS